MPESAQRVPEDSAAYREFARLYDLARDLRPTAVDGWSRGGRVLYATSGPGGFDHETGAIGVHEPLLRHELTGGPSETPRRQAHALAAVLHRATEAGMPKDAPAANAIRNAQSLALHDGIASVRAATDLSTFAAIAGYPQPAFDPSQTSGTYAAANALIHQVSGRRVDRAELLERLNEGPVAMQFDRLADAVVQNRLWDRVEPGDQQGVRRQLIETMLHPAWEQLSGRSPEAGRHVAEEIGRALNAKADEIGRGSRRPDQQASADGSGVESAVSRPAGQAPPGRFLTGSAHASGAAARTPSLGDGSRAQAERGAAAARRQPGVIR